MSKYVIRTTDGKFVRGGRRGTSSHLSFVESLQDARVYERRLDAVNSINQHFSSSLGLEAVPVNLVQPAYPFL